MTPVLQQLVDDALGRLEGTTLGERARELPVGLLGELVRQAPAPLRIEVGRWFIEHAPSDVGWAPPPAPSRRRKKSSCSAVERRRRAKVAPPVREEITGPLFAEPVVVNIYDLVPELHGGDTPPSIARSLEEVFDGAVRAPVHENVPLVHETARRVQRCGICREPGHKQRTCPKRDPLQQVADSEHGSGPPIHPPREASEPPPAPPSSAVVLEEPTAAPSNGAAKPLPWAMRPPLAPPAPPSASKPKKARRCGLCREYGHRRETCPKANGEPARSASEHVPRAAAASELPQGARVLSQDEIRNRLLERRLGRGADA